MTAAARKLGYDNFGWQRNYYEHVIRDESELGRICEYIRANPLNWEADENNPANVAVLSVAGRHS